MIPSPNELGLHDYMYISYLKAEFTPFADKMFLQLQLKVSNE